MLSQFRSSVRSLFGRVGAKFKKPSRQKKPPVSREEVERLVGMPVSDLSLYVQALTHRSTLRGQRHSHLHSNERLEFLGDAVLGFVTAEYLYHHFLDRDEGFLTRMRAKLVSGEALAAFAEELDLGELVLLSSNMQSTNGRENPTILADAFEAVIGALYLDLGEEAARTFIREQVLVNVDLDDLAEQRSNYKSLLLEYVQAKGWPQPDYLVTQEAGPSHDRIFTVEVRINGKAHGQGVAGSKKKAEQQAAGKALKQLLDEA